MSNQLTERITEAVPQDRRNELQTVYHGNNDTWVTDVDQLPLALSIINDQLLERFLRVSHNWRFEAATTLSNNTISGIPGIRVIFGYRSETPQVLPVHTTGWFRRQTHLDIDKVVSDSAGYKADFKSTPNRSESVYGALFFRKVGIGPFAPAFRAEGINQPYYVDSIYISRFGYNYKEGTILKCSDDPSRIQVNLQFGYTDALISDNLNKAEQGWTSTVAELNERKSQLTAELADIEEDLKDMNESKYQSLNQLRQEATQKIKNLDQALRF